MKWFIERDGKLQIGESIYNFKSIRNDNPEDRLSKMLSEHNDCWHNITYTSSNKMLFALLSKLSVDDFQLTLKVLSFTNAINGKIYRSSEKPFYFHFPGASSVQGTSKFVKFSEWPKTDYFIKSASQATSIIGELLSFKTSIPTKQCKINFARLFINRLAIASKKSGIDLDKGKCINAMIEESQAYDETVRKLIFENSGGMDFKWKKYGTDFNPQDAIVSNQTEYQILCDFVANNPFSNELNDIAKIG